MLLCHALHCSLQMPQTLDKLFSIAGARPTPALTWEQVVWAVLVFRHEDRIVGKACEVPYNLVQKAAAHYGFIALSWLCTVHPLTTRKLQQPPGEHQESTATIQRAPGIDIQKAPRINSNHP